MMEGRGRGRKGKRSVQRDLEDLGQCRNIWPWFRMVRPTSLWRNQKNGSVRSTKVTERKRITNLAATIFELVADSLSQSSSRRSFFRLILEISLSWEMMFFTTSMRLVLHLANSKTIGQCS